MCVYFNRCMKRDNGCTTWFNKLSNEPVFESFIIPSKTVKAHSTFISVIDLYNGMGRFGQLIVFVYCYFRFFIFFTFISLWKIQSYGS